MAEPEEIPEQLFECPKCQDQGDYWDEDSQEYITCDCICFLEYRETDY